MQLVMQVHVSMYPCSRLHSLCMMLCMLKKQYFLFSCCVLQLKGILYLMTIFFTYTSIIWLFKEVPVIVIYATSRSWAIMYITVTDRLIKIFLEFNMKSKKAVLKPPNRTILSHYVFVKNGIA